jgi:tyrosyl-tRNA synthetase
LENIGEDQTIKLEDNFIVEDKINIIEFLAIKNILKSKREAREFVESGAISINEEKINVGDFEIKKLGDKKEFLLRIGKKKYFKVVVV